MTDRKKRLAQCITLGALLIIGGSAFFVAPEETAAKEERKQDIFIRQAQIAGATADGDFAVIGNNEDCALDLSGWKLRKRTASGTESSIKVFGSETILPSHEALLWANSKNDFAKSLDAHEESSATLTDNNSLALFDADNVLIDSLSWGTVAQPFRSDEPSATNPKASESIIRTSKTGTATLEKTDLPKGKTFDTASLDFCDVSKDRASDSSVVLSEILANPAEDESEGEFIELENRSEKSIDLSGWKLRDASKTGIHAFPKESILDREAFLVLSRKEFGFTLNNTNETVALEDPKGAVADTVHWDSSRENISLAFDGARWRSTKFVTKGTANRFGNDPSAQTRFPKKGFANISLDFSAKVRDADGDTTSLVWDFGDGHKSYKSKTSHAYTKKGKYRATLRYSDSISDIEKTFTVKIEGYVAPKVRITSLSPNPTGADTGKEFILVQNKSKKKVDLKGWSIATKSSSKAKNFVNHKITKSFVLKPGETKRLTHKESAFTLGNTRQHIEFRDPQGKAIQKFRYKLNKSAPENAEFFKEPNQPWQWKNPTTLDTNLSGA